MSFLGMFLRFVVMFIVGVLLFYQWPKFPPIWFGMVSVGLIILSLGFILSNCFKSKSDPFQRDVYGVINGAIRYALPLIIGVSWAFWQSFFMPIVPERVLNQPVWVTGQIIELPNQTLTTHRARIKYHLKVSSIARNSGSKAVDILYNPPSLNQPVLSINWYLSTKALQALPAMPQLGETWRMRVKLKANHASMNPVGFDYEAWLFQKGMAGKGYVKAFTKSEQLGSTVPPVVQKIADVSVFSLNAWRHWLSSRLNKVFQESEFNAFYQALTFGDKSTIAADDWVLLQNTGTIHLMVISGLHMGIIAFLGFVTFRILWRWVGYRVTAINLPECAALGALLFATLYLVISGFSIPTQRAWLMVVLILGFVLIRRSFQPWSALAMAAFLIVLLDTSSVLSFGFWLSFIAVALIFLALNSLKKFKQHAERKEDTLGIDGLDERNVSLWESTAQKSWQNIKALLWLQWILTLGLAPFLIWAFHSLPIYSFIANLIAVPFISFLGLPWLFLSSVLGLFSVELGQWMISVLDLFWGKFWGVLQWINQLPLNTVAFTDRSIFWLLSVYALLFWGLNLKRLKYQLWVLVAVFVWMMSLSFGLLNQSDRPNKHQAILTVLDVGQAQAIVIETQNHVVLYDLGAKWGSTMDGAKLAVLPYLKAKGWLNVDLLIVSHSDQDHAGGLVSLLKQMPVSQSVSGQPNILNKRLQQSQIQTHFSLCEAGQQWQLDGVLFEILSPKRAWLDSKLTTDNDQSCVLKVSTGHTTIIITGDLSQKGEELLLQTNKASALKADLLVAGHHGSQSSSSLAWLTALSPEHVVFSAGYLNRFKFPNKAVIERIEQVASIKSWWNTACSGALQFELTPEKINLMQESRNTRRKWYHHRCLNTQKGQLFQ